MSTERYLNLIFRTLIVIAKLIAMSQPFADRLHKDIEGIEKDFYSQFYG